MALNIPGVIAVVVFYILILATGIWAARKSRNTERKNDGGQAETVLLGDRSINLLVGIFTMTGMLSSGTQVVAFKSELCCVHLPSWDSFIFIGCF